MYEFMRLSKIFETSERIAFDDSSRIILMSDCHRGDGSWADSFCKNQNLYYAALTYYHNRNYIYIELGDGDELWENKEPGEIMRQHRDVFSLLSKFIIEDRGYFIYGNHDIVKKNKGFAGGSEYQYFDERDIKNVSLFENIKFHEGLVLKHKVTGKEIFLVHGHQVNFLDDRMWWLNRFLVRYLWRPLELLGVNDPTSAAKNYNRKALVENKLINWSYNFV